MWLTFQTEKGMTRYKHDEWKQEPYCEIQLQEQRQKKQFQKL